MKPASLRSNRNLFAGTKRRKLPNERSSITHKFSIGGHEGYITVGKYEDGTAGRNLHQDGEGRVHAFRHHGRVRAFRLDLAAIRRSASSARGQIRELALRTLRLHGQSENPLREIGRGLHRALARREIHLAPTISMAIGPATEEERGCRAAAARRCKDTAPVTVMKVAEPETATRPRAAIDDAPSCSECGMLMTPNGSCYKCSNCGSTSGCS